MDVAQEQENKATIQHRDEYPEELWEEWSNGVTREYTRLSDRITVLLELDLKARESGLAIEEIVEENLSSECN